MNKHESLLRNASLGFALLSLGLLACAIGLGGVRPDIDPQRWWHGRGPVVPHETFPAECALCHAGSSWTEIRDDFAFDHLGQTGVALVGEHASAECLRCHNDRGPVELFASRGCSGCHEDVHRGQLGKNCEDCHDEMDWRPRGQIAKHAETRFPLVGAHAATACFRCHPGAESGEFARTDIECVTCHADDLTVALNPNHVAQGWVDSCDRCHVPTSWTSANFAHVGFALTGAHAGANCESCHLGSVFAATPSNCDACHQAEYDATASPDHMGLGLPLNCEQCHGTASWSGANFAHTVYPLTGAHTAIDCLDCHVGGTFMGTPNTCAGCHQSDYDATTNPSHLASGFPTMCEQCHTTTTWLGAVFNHPFPITSGAHDGFDCSDCHLVPSNFSLFSCIDCHEHNKPDTDDDHDEVSGYSYDSPSCLACHPNGKN